MTIFKSYVVGRHHGWARTPLTSLLLREGLVVSFLIFGELIFVPICGHAPEIYGLLGMMVITVVYESIRTFGPAAGNAAFA
jgi:membrane associated rhomboid family serine protease